MTLDDAISLVLSHENWLKTRNESKNNLLSSVHLMQNTHSTPSISSQFTSSSNSRSPQMQHYEPMSFIPMLLVNLL